MATHKNWFQSNICDRSNIGIDLDVTLTKISDWNLSTRWNDAVDNVVQLLVDHNKPIYIGLSGGIDSEFVCTAFEQRNISYIPVIVDTPGNQVEVRYAYDYCTKWSRDPVVLNKTAGDMLRIYYQKILLQCHGYGDNSMATYIVGEYAKENNGIYIMAEHLIDEKRSGGFNAGCNEWDFYNDLLLGVDNTHYFFNYTPEISAAMIREFPDHDDVQKSKSEFYQLDYRPKMKYAFDSVYQKTQNDLRRTKYLTHNPHYIFGSRDEYLKMLETME
jgi:hypothetical protein